ncbi:MAG TPA: desulfoferrodoxin [Clostridia bacterium]|nr:desulfoferrodoxin [Clostridia bacterium]
MAKIGEIYKCDICGNIVHVLHGGEGELVCCGEPMILQEEQKAEMKNEKHVPVVEKIEGGYKVTVGSTLHPMIDAHYIEWIELQIPKQTLIAFLEPNEEPVAIFKTDEKAIAAREYCNIHGLWINESPEG